MNIISGNLITLALEGHFDVIVHGCNCFGVMGAGIAAQMQTHFNAKNVDLTFIDDHRKYYLNWRNIELLGNIVHYRVHRKMKPNNLWVVNAHTQYLPGPFLNYEALILCLKKLNIIFGGLKIGLPAIGCGIGGGSFSKVYPIIKENLRDCKVTIVLLPEEMKSLSLNIKNQ